MDFDFSAFLVLATVVTGIIWGSYLGYLKITDRISDPENEPILVEYARSFFPIVLIVLLLRSFLVEPFRIPSGSMMPTLLIGDFILVNKFAFGVRLPVLHTKILETGEPQRGDITVFRFPNDPSVDYIKRVIGLPGDRITYFNKKLFINGDPIKQIPIGTYRGVGQGKSMSGVKNLVENLRTVEHNILVTPGQPGMEGDYTVPKGHYFVMGDNRDNSNDSRYWGTVPEKNLVGKAFFIWMNWDWQNKGIDFGRLGTLLK
ncbi:MAG: signal peptidase I [Methylococcales bacterium]